MEFLKEANLPDKRVGLVCVSEDIKESLKMNISKLGINQIYAPQIKNIESPVRSHADVMLHHLKADSFVCEPTVFDYFKKEFEKYDINLICGKTVAESKYPRDCYYNAARVGDCVFMNIADSSILDFDKRNYTRKINVKQGYAKCSICIVSNKALITSDEGIYKAATENGFDVLKIQSGYIKIEGYDHGFIGGATGLLSNDVLGFCGDLKTHPDNQNISAFLRNYNVYPENLDKGILQDIGSILPIAYK